MGNIAKTIKDKNRTKTTVKRQTFTDLIVQSSRNKLLEALPEQLCNQQIKSGNST